MRPYFGVANLTDWNDPHWGHSAEEVKQMPREILEWKYKDSTVLGRSPPSKNLPLEKRDNSGHHPDSMCEP